MVDRRKRPMKFGGREDYFAVNDKPMGVSTSVRVSGRLGELAQRFWNPSEAEKEAKRLNRAYQLGHEAGYDFAYEQAIQFLRSPQHSGNK